MDALFCLYVMFYSGSVETAETWHRPVPLLWWLWFKCRGLEVSLHFFSLPRLLSPSFLTARLQKCTHTHTHTHSSYGHSLSWPIGSLLPQLIELVSSSHLLKLILWKIFLSFAKGIYCENLSDSVSQTLSNSCHPPATAAAKLLQSCPTLCDPIDGSPPGSPVPGILQARTLEWVAISFSNAWKWKVKGKSFSRVRLFTTPWTAAHQAPPSMGFSRQEYWSGVPLPSLPVTLPHSNTYTHTPFTQHTTEQFQVSSHSTMDRMSLSPPKLMCWSPNPWHDALQR